MTGSFQQHSRIRKLVYFALIIALFTGTIVIRRQSFAMSAIGLGDGEIKGIEPLADELSLREHHIGDVELTGAAVNLMLMGSRGIVVCWLWSDAIEKQKKHEWNQLERRVDELTMLQPHFIKPWQFQSWNLAYNASVEFDRIQDKYFYITRGIHKLDQGAQRNRDNPDLRFDLGIFYQNKLGIADENHTLRSLFQMSSIDPRERDPESMRRRQEGRSIVDYQAFEEFCKAHPQLVRRLRTIPDSPCDTPEKVLFFLEDNARIPSLFQDEALGAGAGLQTPLKPLAERFPVLPPRSHFDLDELTYESQLADEHDNFVAARAWFSYAQDPVDDPKLKRKPRMIAKVIFQSYPGRAQVYHADRLKDEGWFDRDGWTITDWFPVDAKDPRGPKRPVTVGDRQRDWGHEAWEKAFELYKRHGHEHGLLLSPEELAQAGPDELSDYEYKRKVSNYPHFYHRTDVERLRPAIEARKHFFLAEQHRRSGDRSQALAMYEDPAAFGPPATWSKPTGWKKLFLEHSGFRNDRETQRQTLETQNRYLKLVDQVRGPALRRLVLVAPQVLPASPFALANAMQVSTLAANRGIGVPLQGPFDDLDYEGKPLIDPNVRHDVQQRQRGR